MKQLLIVAFSMLAFVAKSNAQIQNSQEFVVNAIKAQAAIEKKAFNVINWRVGDYQNYKITAGFMGDVGTMEKWVEREEGNMIWVHSKTAGQIGDNLTEVLLDRATGQVKKIIQNGREQEIPNDPLEIISQDETNVTVPAGTFQAIHIVAKSKKIKKLEAWINPRDTIMDGNLKMIIESGFVPMTLALTKFGSKKN